jgi:phosphatidylserine/phosphatidylglycerophosphate/cardiolipin synthase-like enzyme
MTGSEMPSAEGPISNYEILAPLHFFEDFNAHARRASGRVLAQTMYVEDGWALNQMADALIHAQSNGLETELHVDAYSQLIQDQHIHWVPQIRSSVRSKNSDARQAKHDKLVNIAEHGVPVTVTNPPNLLEKALPFVGRNHIKLAVVDDVAWLGGLSYRDADLLKEDFMMRITDPRIVCALEEIFHTTDYTSITDDKTYDFGHTKLVRDCGRRGQSTIFDRGLHNVMNASESVRLISQYSPNGKMAAALALKATVGIDVLSITSSRDSISEWFGAYVDRASAVISSARGRSIPSAYSKTRIHAKALLVDADNPDRVEGMVGSHNLTRAGVRLGTQEVALFSQDPEFIKNLRAYCANLEGRIVLEHVVALNIGEGSL